ncbi:adenylyltransferase/cytidyltransferase family protein [Candidatus Uhrbacteria bacterium]|nr:adenylyltransferase/cytidyltransferase family protein [Candidatus Uhrbacteria bacterium]
MKKIAMCFGTFDGLHVGHEDYFRQAKDCADELFVVVSRDETVVDLKGQLPLNNEQDRLRVVMTHPNVDDARLGYLDDKYKIIEEVRPDYICLGHDQEAFTERLEAELARRGIAATVVRCVPYEPDIRSSSLLRGMREEEPMTDAEYDEQGMPL